MPKKFKKLAKVLLQRGAVMVFFLMLAVAVIDIVIVVSIIIYVGFFLFDQQQH